MCFNYKVSLITFAIGTIFSILLIKHGNKQYASENVVSGIFFIFIALIQFMDFLFWIDIKNKIGINKITTILGPILNVGQPTILYLIKYMYYTPNITTFKDFNLPVALLNLFYFLYFITMYIRFLTNEKLTTHAKHNHLQWPWIKYANHLLYISLLAINMFYLFNFNYALSLFVVTYTFLIISKIYFNYNTGELWCFFGAFIPMIMFYLSFRIDDIFGFNTLLNYK